jgi:DNA-binding winged helix-turn-helix (wHTH) protein
MDFSPGAFPQAPVRAKDLAYIVDCIRRGECCAVVGPSNTGKSLLLRSLLTDEVRQRCSRTETPPVAVFVDCLAAGDSAHAFYELLLSRVAEEVETSGAPDAVIRALTDLHREVLHSTTEVATRSLFDSGLRELHRRSDVALVLILDEFDDVFRALPPWPFRQLRALRDGLGHRLCYVPATSRRLERVRSGDETTYEFEELFHLTTRILRPLSREDARHLVAYLSSRQGTAPGEEWASLTIDLCGGHPGLLKRVYNVLATVQPELTSATPQAAAAELVGTAPIQHECQRLWDELEAEEQAGLLMLVKGGEPALIPQQREALEAKGLTAERETGGLSVFSPIVEAFVRSQSTVRSPAKRLGVHCNPETGQIWVDDREVTLELSEPQRMLVRFLYKQSGKTCSQDEIAGEVWGTGEGVSSGAIYELIKRVRQKLEPDWKHPRYIVTVQGKGYRLETAH